MTRALLDDIAYRHDDWFEAFVHEASLVPVEDEPLFRFMKERASNGETWGGLVKLAKQESAYIADVLQEVADRGPIKANELSDPRPREGEWWGSRSIGTLALDYLFRIGAVGIRRVGNFEKEFDLLERIVPTDVVKPADSFAGRRAQRVTRTIGGSPRYWHRSVSDRLLSVAQTCGETALRRTRRRWQAPGGRYTGNHSRDVPASRCRGAPIDARSGIAVTV